MEEKELNQDNQEVLEETPKQEDDFVIKMPESEKQNEPEVVPNKPAHWMMRIAGGIIDVCLLFLSLYGLRYLFFMTPMGKAYDNNAYEAIKISDTYKLEKLVDGSDETFGYMMYEEDEKYASLVKSGYQVYQDAENKNYIVANHDDISSECQKAFNAAVTGNQDYKNYTFNARLIEFGIISISMTIAEAVFLLGIPLLNKRRATLGKLAAGTMVIHNRFEVAAKWYQMLGRFFWILIFESLLPLLFISNAIITPLVVGTLMFIITLFNKNRRTLHDYITVTRVIDKRTFVKLSDQ